MRIEVVWGEDNIKLLRILWNILFDGESNAATIMQVSEGLRIINPSGVRNVVIK